tara:strand:- start:25 stop:213 length:189 start_codon:yes stop_codon:yes gene_type:complete
MEEQYTIDEILKAVQDLQDFKKEKNFEENKDKIKNTNTIIPADTLKLIEDAEKVIKSKMRSE